MHHVDIQF